MVLEKFIGTVPYPDAFYIHNSNYWLLITFNAIHVVEPYNLRPVFSFAPNHWQYLLERINNMRIASTRISARQSDDYLREKVALSFHPALLNHVDSVDSKNKETSGCLPRKARVLRETLFFLSVVGDLFMLPMINGADAIALNPNFEENLPLESSWEIINHFAQSHVVDIEVLNNTLIVLCLDGRLHALNDSGEVIRSVRTTSGDLRANILPQSLAADLNNVAVHLNDSKTLLFNKNFDLISEQESPRFEKFAEIDQQIAISSLKNASIISPFKHFSFEVFSTPILIDQEITVFSDGTTFRGEQQISGPIPHEIVDATVSPNRLFVSQAFIIKNTHPISRDLPDLRFVPYLSLEELPFDLSLDTLYKELTIFVHLIGVQEANDFLLKSYNSKLTSPKLLSFLQKILSEMNATTVEAIEIDEEEDSDHYAKILELIQAKKDISDGIRHAIQPYQDFLCPLCNSQIKNDRCENGHPQIFDVFTGNPIDDPFYLSCRTCNVHTFSAFKELYDNKLPCPLCCSTMRDCFE